MSNDSLRRAYRARWNKTINEAETIARIMREKNPDNVLGEVVGELRDRVENLNQSFHEFNAYLNAYSIACGQRKPDL